jgi:hypothetical protein
MAVNRKIALTILLLASVNIASANGIFRRIDARICANPAALSFVDRIDQSFTCAPEIDPSSAMSGLALLAGGLAVLRGRRSKQSDK